MGSAQEVSEGHPPSLDARQTDYSPVVQARSPQLRASLDALRSRAPFRRTLPLKRVPMS